MNFATSSKFCMTLVDLHSREQSVVVSVISIVFCLVMFVLGQNLGFSIGTTAL